MEKIGKYEIINELGSGATSTVFLALDPFSQEQVALKLFKKEVMSDETRGAAFRKLLRNEASLAGKLRRLFSEFRFGPLRELVAALERKEATALTGVAD